MGRATSGDGAPKLQISVPCRGRTRPEVTRTSWELHPTYQQTGVYPCPLSAGSARPNPKMGAPDPENPLLLGFSVLGEGLRPWSQTMVSEGARPWGRGRSGACELRGPAAILFILRDACSD